MEQQWTTHQNPIERYFFVQSFQKRSKAEQLLLTNQFLSGDWDVFGTWARLVVIGKIGKPSSVVLPKTAHGRFWSGAFWNAPGEQRVEFLEWLMAAQLGNSSSKDFPGLGREWPKPSVNCTKLLLQYLNEFTELRRDRDGDFPDDRLVDLVRDVSFDAAIPFLRKVVGSKRYFSRLITDYSTSPEEQDQALRAALGVFVDYSRSNASAVKAELEAQLKAALETEIVGLKIQYARNEVGPRDGEDESLRKVRLEDVELQKKGEVLQVSSKVQGIRTRAEWLELALHAIAGKKSAINEFNGFLESPPQADWIRKTDERSVAILDSLNPSKSAVFGTSNGLDGFNRRSGKLRFSIRFDEESDSHSLDRHIEYFVRLDGRILKSVAFFEKTPKLRRSYHVIVIDPQSGEVLDIMKVQPDSGAALRAVKAGYLFDNTDSVWIQNFEGKVLAERKKKKEDVFFVVESGRVFRFSSGQIEELNESLKARVQWSMAPEAKRFLSDSPEKVAEIDGEIYASNSGVLLRLNDRGELSSSTVLSAHKYKLTPIVSKNTIWVAETFSIVAIDRSNGQIRKRTPLVSEIEQWVPVGEDRIAVLAKNGLFMFSKIDETLNQVSWPKDFQFTPHMTSLSSTGDHQGGVILKSYSEGHWLMRLN